MTKAEKEEVKILKKCFEDIIWMAIRYAHGRHTYAPGMVRQAVKSYKTLYPDFKLREDMTLEPQAEFSGIALRGDYLNDLFEV